MKDFKAKFIKFNICNGKLFQRLKSSAQLLEVVAMKLADSEAAQNMVQNLSVLRDDLSKTLNCTTEIISEISESMMVDEDAMGKNMLNKVAKTLAAKSLDVGDCASQSLKDNLQRMKLKLEVKEATLKEKEKFDHWLLLRIFYSRHISF
ncbi:unnamed protein product [Soboliphyme baturini]|uniref:Rx_N domain-containing protein n=1 Tax=Soboliphyme baturini TaxID=241478 RepID=A0A183J2Y9_9BILA|nr:unnamed protein product [Soboliphyme baturini]